MSTTIKKQYEIKMEKFRNEYSDENLKKKEKELKSKQKELKNTDIFDGNYMTIESEIERLHTEIYDIKNQTSMIDYLLRNQNSLINHDEIENYNEIENDEEGIMKYLNVLSKKNDKDILDNFNRNDTNHVEYEYSCKLICEYCDVPLIIDTKLASKICQKCGIAKVYFDPFLPQWSDTVEVSSPFCYKRINHFREKLKQLQGYESKCIPDEVLERIIEELKKRRINDPNNITKNIMKDILKKIKLTDYYSNINTIIYRLGGKKPPRIPKKLEEELVKMFTATEEVFENNKEQFKRKNTLDYEYQIHKMLLIIGERNSNVLKYVQHFSLLKSRDKLYTLDKYWKLICNKLNWTFHRSL